MAPASSPGPSGSLYLYGLCPCPDHPLDLPVGMEGRVSLVVVETLAALVEDHLDLQAIQADNTRLLAAVLSHDRVLCHLFEQTPLLPLRFGTQLPDLDHLRAYLTDSQAPYQEKLQALADQAEYQINLTPRDLTPPPPPEGLKGREYFLAKKQRLQDLTLAQRRQREERQGILQTIAASYTMAIADEATPKVYLLVPRSQSPRLAQDLAQWQTQAPHWQIQISAALPPYHFV